MKEIWDLFLDESGEFKDDRLRRDRNPSFVGGVLCRANAISEKAAMQMFGGRKSHATEEADEQIKAENIGILRKLKQIGCQLVVFENTERLMIVNGDITYLNILADGIVKLLRNLSSNSLADTVLLRVKVATRTDVEKKDTLGIVQTIGPQEYDSRLRERVILAMGTETIPNGTWQCSFANAKKDSQLMLADLACNYYLTRGAKTKFTPEQRNELAAIFQEVKPYPVFEESTVRMVRRLMAENNYGDAMAFVASAKTMTADMQEICRGIFQCLKGMSARERDYHFRQVSLKTGIYADRRAFAEGRVFAEHYRARFLVPLAADPVLADAARRWMFDTDFFLLTMADHMGDMKGCELYSDRCKANLDIVLQGWEQLDYYYAYRIREINVLMGRFDFDGVLKTVESLEEFIQEAQALSKLVAEDAGIRESQVSVSVGKVKGQCVEAYANLLGRRPDLMAEALEASDAALEEFRDEEDRLRQYQYRSALYLRARDPEKALRALVQIPEDEDSLEPYCQRYLEAALGKSMSACEFDIMHYTCVMRGFVEAHDQRGKMMAELLIRDKRFMQEIGQDKPGTEGRHPWQITLWNIAAWYRSIGSKRAWEEYSKRALDIARADHEYVSMMTFALCISADRLLTARREADKGLGAVEREFANVVCALQGNDLPDSISDWFGLPKEKGAPVVNNDELERIADSWLR